MQPIKTSTSRKKTITHLSTLPGHLAINIEPTTKLNPLTTFPTIIGVRRPVASIQKTQHASPINAIMEFMDWKRRTRVEVKPIVVNICKGEKESRGKGGERNVRVLSSTGLHLRPSSGQRTAEYIYRINLNEPPMPEKTYPSANRLKLLLSVKSSVHLQSFSDRRLAPSQERIRSFSDSLTLPNFYFHILDLSLNERIVNVSVCVETGEG